MSSRPMIWSRSTRRTTSAMAPVTSWSSILPRGTAYVVDWSSTAGATAACTIGGTGALDSRSTPGILIGNAPSSRSAPALLLGPVCRDLRRSALTRVG